MNITRKNFLRLTSATTMAAAIEAVVTACGGGGGGDSTSSSASPSTGTGTGTTPTGTTTPGISNASSGTGDGTTITPPTTPPASPSKSGYWSNPLTWASAGTPAGFIPTASDNIYISSAQTVYLDGDAVCATLTIYGTLRSLDTPTQNINLTTGNINVMGSGALQIGTEAAPFPAAYKATITLNGAEVGRVSRTVQGSRLGFSNSGEGRSIRVEAGGALRLVGAPLTYTRTKLNAHAAAGASSFTLADNTGWKTGDEIVIGTTDFYGVAEPEKLTLNRDASGFNVSTTTPIAAARWGVMQYVTNTGMSVTPGALTGAPVNTPTQLDERAFVINLTRNIIVQGANDTAWTSNKFGAHCMFMGRASEVILNRVQFRRVGQAGALGRYPIHWHMMSYSMPSGMNAVSDGTFLGSAIGNHYAKSCSISESGQRMMTIHGTHGVTLDANVGYDITGHAIFLEDGSEQNNFITDNVVIKVRAPTATNKLLNHDIPADPVSNGYQGVGITGFNGSSGIWNTNPNNSIIGNWINNAEGTGIWNAFALKCFGLSTNVAIAPNNFVFKAFQNNIAFGNKGVGVQTNRPPVDDIGNTGDGATYTYLANFQNSPVVGTQVFKNSAGGYSNRVSLASYQYFVCADNAGMDVFGQSSGGTATNFLNVGESLNNSTSKAISSVRAAFATYHELLNFQNGIVVNFPWIDGVFPTTSNTKAGGGMFRLDDLYTLGIFFFSQVSGNMRINSPTTYRTKPPNIDGSPLATGSGSGSRNWTLAGAIRDLNGNFVPAGNHWVYDDPFFTYEATSPTQVVPFGNNGVYTSDRYFSVGNFNHTDDSGLDFQMNLPMAVTRLDTTNTTQGVWIVGDGLVSPQLGWMRHFSPKNGGRYKLQFPGHIATTVVQFDVNAMDNASDIFLIGVEWSNNVPAKVYQRAEHFNSYTGNVPNNPGNSSISRVLTLTTSFSNVLADTTGTIYWQDTTNNTVWFQVRVGSLALANTYFDPYINIYKSVSIAITA